MIDDKGLIMKLLCVVVYAYVSDQVLGVWVLVVSKLARVYSLGCH